MLRWYLWSGLLVYSYHGVETFVRANAEMEGRYMITSSKRNTVNPISSCDRVVPCHYLGTYSLQQVCLSRDSMIKTQTVLRLAGGPALFDVQNSALLLELMSQGSSSRAATPALLFAVIFSKDRQAK